MRVIILRDFTLCDAGHTKVWVLQGIWRTALTCTTQQETLRKKTQETTIKTAQASVGSKETSNHPGRVFYVSCAQHTCEPLVKDRAFVAVVWICFWPCRASKIRWLRLSHAVYDCLVPVRASSTLASAAFCNLALASAHSIGILNLRCMRH